jgi:phosphate transport system substrate-binding protein
MKKLFNSRSLVLMLAVVFAVSFLFTACGDTTDSSNNAGQAGSLKGSVTVSGSTSVQPLAQDLSDAFKKVESGITVDVQGGGSTQGITDASEGTSDIGTSSRDLQGEEKNLGFTEHVIAYDGIAIVTHPSITVSNLTKDQIVKIFKGEIKNWKDVGGPDRDILVVSREEGSGTRGAFEELLKLQEKKGTGMASLVRADALIADGNGAVKANIASKDNAIGYISLGFVDESIKKISVEGTECSIENVKSKAYPISRPFIMLTKGDMKPEVKAFIDFILSDEGQKIVGGNYITIK